MTIKILLVFLLIASRSDDPMVQGQGHYEQVSRSTGGFELGMSRRKRNVVPSKEFMPYLFRFDNLLCILFTRECTTFSIFQEVSRLKKRKKSRILE